MKNIYGITILALAFSAAVFTGGCGNNAPETPRAPVTVRVDTIRAENTQTGYNYTGVIEENYASSLSFSVAGTLEQVSAVPGQEVRRGQALARLNDASLQDAYRAAKATLDKAEDAHRRMKMLHEAGSLPDMKWVEVQTSLAQAQSMERIAKKDLGDAVLYAPFDGVIARREAEPGVNVAPGQPVFQLMKIDRVYAVVSVPEGDIPSVHTGMTASVSVGALPDGPFAGQVTEKGVSANALSHTYRVKVAVDNPLRQMMPGMVCSVRIQSPREYAEIVLPPASVQIDDQGQSFVWLAREGRAEKRVVTTGGLTGRGVIIDGGLSEGDRVIVEGNQKVSQGMNISIR